MRREYAFPNRFKAQLWISATLLPGLLLLIVILAAVGLDAVTTSIMIVLLGAGSAVIGLDRWWIFRHFAERVVIDPEGIDARPFHGRTVRMKWTEIRTRRESTRRDPFKGPVPQISLSSEGAGSLIVIAGDIPGFDELREEVRVRTPNAGTGADPRWWERVFLPG